MVVVGADVHKRTHTFVAVDEVGRKVGEKVVEATTVGHRQAVRWARTQFGVELVWAIEDCRHLSARLERDLLSADQKVVRVPSKLMAQSRASARTRGKSDPIDALAYLREPDLPVASHDEVCRELKLLVDRREDLVGQRTSTINRLLWRVHELDPGRAPKPASLDRSKHRRLLADWLASQPGLVAERVRAIAPALLAMPGCAELTAAKIIGEIAGVTRFKSEAAFARHAGVAPIPVWSGNTAGRVRMTRTGNRQLNAALHRIAVTQIRLDGLGQAYSRRRLAAGDSSTEALRCLKRRLARVVFHHLHTDHQNRIQPCQQAAA
ncbi:transposase [Mycobacterium sp. IEC1808]|nr:transposase [Mycobacterium sp. IEC1808]